MIRWILSFKFLILSLGKTKNNDWSNWNQFCVLERKKKSWEHKMIQVEEYHGFVECQQCGEPMSHNIKTGGEFKVVYVECRCSSRQSR